jgi:Zn-dependent protease with chaperone function
MYALPLLSEAGPDTSLTWLLLLALAFFVVMIFVGWWVSRKEAASASAMPAGVDPDDLTKIEGIGPKVKQVLKDAGIATFADLAVAKSEQIQPVLDAAGLQMMDPAGWIEQAKLAVKGDWNALQKLQDELKGGRRA